MAGVRKREGSLDVHVFRWLDRGERRCGCCLSAFTQGDESGDAARLAGARSEHGRDDRFGNGCPRNSLSGRIRGKANGLVGACRSDRRSFGAAFLGRGANNRARGLVHRRNRGWTFDGRGLRSERQIPQHGRASGHRTRRRFCQFPRQHVPASDDCAWRRFTLDGSLRRPRSLLHVPDVRHSTNNSQRREPPQILRSRGCPSLRSDQQVSC